MKKKMLALLMAAVLVFGLTACGNKNEAFTPADFEIAVMTGPTAIGLTKVMTDAKNQTAANNYNFHVYGTADEISTG